MINFNAHHPARKFVHQKKFGAIFLQHRKCCRNNGLSYFSGPFWETEKKEGLVFIIELRWIRKSNLQLFLDLLLWILEKR